ncbi:MAG: 50S ribosomal protein L21 [Candidatus Dormibacteria bacterium]
MTYAIVQHGGRQYRVTAGDRLLVDRLGADVGTMVALEPVLMVAGEDDSSLGAPAVDGVRVAALVVSHRRGKKLRVFKYKAKKRYRKTMGFRADLTELRVQQVLAKGEKIPTAPTPDEKPKPEIAARAKVAKVSAAEEEATGTLKPPTSQDAQATARRQRVAKSRVADEKKADSRKKNAKPADDVGATTEAGDDGA